MDTPVPGKGRRLPSQRGSLLIEFMVVAALALVVAVWGSQEWGERVRILQARSLAAWMEPVRNALQAHLAQVAAQLDPAVDEGSEASTSAGLMVAPTWSDLQARGLLPSGWQAAGPLGQSLGVVVWRAAGCGSAACPMHALVHTRSALRRPQGELDESMIAEWLMAAQGRGFVLWPHRPEAFSGAGQQISVPAGSSGWAPGMVALLVTQGNGGGSTGTPSTPGTAVDTENFLRMRDARDPDFQAGVSAQGVIRSDRRLAARDSLVLERGWDSGTACPDEGALGRDRIYPGVLVCRQGKWELVARAAGGGYLINSRRGCKNSQGVSTANPYTGGCFCPPGFNTMQLSESGAAASADGLSTGYLCTPN